ARPLVTIPVFPGTNCEYDSVRAFEDAGARTRTVIIRNLSPEDIEGSIRVLADAIQESQIVMIPGGFSAGDEPEGSGKFIASFFRNPRVADAVAGLMDNRDGLILGICNGFQALIKLGLLPWGHIRDLASDSPTLTFNTIGRHVSCLVHTRVVHTASPWLSLCQPGELHAVPVSHGEGRFIADRAHLDRLVQGGQIAFQYADPEGNPRMDMPWNPNGSVMAVEGITSPDGRILGKMGHSERKGPCLYANVPGNKDQRIFEAGVRYFTG
ncbi:MAG: phosphoribosylformylglycinamidine synthase subunit PurQ, partial [Spirochaetales bacterium]|nr:phosphoribosylformylglycinamidine synthase subunit PurQ [Spirochaetales bacterium]